MGQSYSLLCQGSIPLPSLLKCFYPGHACASHRSNKSQRQYIARKNDFVCGFDEDCNASNEEVIYGQGSMVQDNVISVNNVGQKKVTDMNTNSNTINARNTPRPPVISLLKMNQRFSGSIEEEADFEVREDQPKIHQHKKVSLVIVSQNLDEVSSVKVKTAGGEMADAVTNLKLNDARCTSAENRDTTSSFDLEPPGRQNFCDRKLNSNCHLKFPQQPIPIRRNLFQVGSLEHSPAVFVTSTETANKIPSDVQLNGNVCSWVTDQNPPPMDNILGFLGRNNRRMIEEQLRKRNGNDVRQRVADCKLQRQESVASTSRRNLMVNIAFAFMLYSKCNLIDCPCYVAVCDYTASFALIDSLK